MQEQETCWKLEVDVLLNDSSRVTTFDPSKKKKKKKPLITALPYRESGNSLEPDYDYQELLSRVFDKLRVNDLEVSTEKPRRVIMPPNLFVEEGAQTTTVCLNFAHLCRMIHRNPDHVMKFCLGQLEINGRLLQRLEMKGLVSSKDFEVVFRRYIDAFVICSCCKSPDTALDEDTDPFTIRCEMCGLVAEVKVPL